MSEGKLVNTNRRPLSIYPLHTSRQAALVPGYCSSQHARALVSVPNFAFHVFARSVSRSVRSRSASPRALDAREKIKYFYMHESKLG